MNNLDDLDPRYSTILCDVWGVLYDGHAPFPGVKERLRRWANEGRRVVLITNAPRPATTIRQRMRNVGIGDDLYAGISTSGEAGMAVLRKLGRPVGFMGLPHDRVDLESCGVAVTEHGYSDIACLSPDDVLAPAEVYRPFLAGLRERDVTFHCLNPDRVVVHQGRRETCPGALADIYEELGGRTVWYGKPYSAIYDHALSLAGDPPRDTVLAIGDSIQTDMAGAAEQGVDAVFVTGGIHAGEELPTDFGAEHGRPGWRPLAVVETIA